ANGQTTQAEIHRDVSANGIRGNSSSGVAKGLPISVDNSPCHKKRRLRLNHLRGSTYSTWTYNGQTVQVIAWIRQPSVARGLHRFCTHGRFGKYSPGVRRGELICSS